LRESDYYRILNRILREIGNHKLKTICGETKIADKSFLIKTSYTDNVINDWQFEAIPGMPKNRLK